MAKRKTAKKLEKENDKLWSQIVRYYRENEPRPCAICGEIHSHVNNKGEVVSDMEAHHLINRWNYNFRWDVHNGVCLCTTHHQYGGEISAHGRKGGYADAGTRFDRELERLFPAHYAWYMEHLYDRRVVKWDYAMKEEKNAELKQLWADMNTNWESEVTE